MYTLQIFRFLFLILFSNFLIVNEKDRPLDPLKHIWNNPEELDSARRFACIHIIRSMRLQRAAELLDKKSGTISDISYSLGFGDPAAFARAFKRQFGMPPSSYQKRETSP